MSVLSDFLREQRTVKRLSQADMAKELQLVFRTYRRYESGETEPTLSEAARIADYFSVSLDYLAGRTDMEP